MEKLFYPKQEPSAAQARQSARILVVQSAVAATSTLLCAGNFLTGYLLLFGASASYCARIAAIPQLGCILQLASPFLFERLRHRKATVVTLCFLFRLLLGLMILALHFFSADSAKLLFASSIYMLAFMVAGFVTPA